MGSIGASTRVVLGSSIVIRYGEVIRKGLLSEPASGELVALYQRYIAPLPSTLTKMASPKGGGEICSSLYLIGAAVTVVVEVLRGDG